MYSDVSFVSRRRRLEIHQDATGYIRIRSGYTLIDPPLHLVGRASRARAGNHIPRTDYIQRDTIPGNIPAHETVNARFLF